jgi:hypothetical protein
MDGNSLKFEVVGTGGEDVVKGGCPEECLKNVCWLVQVRRIIPNGLGAPEENASATTSLIPRDAESTFVPDNLRITTVSESRGLIVCW